MMATTENVLKLFIRSSRCERRNKQANWIWKFPVLSMHSTTQARCLRLDSDDTMMLESALNSSHFTFGCCLVTLVTFMFSFLFRPICLNERTNIEAEKCFFYFIFLVDKRKSQQKQITKTGCACCGRETTKKGNTEEKEKRTVTIPESDWGKYALLQLCTLIRGFCMRNFWGDCSSDDLHLIMTPPPKIS